MNCSKGWLSSGEFAALCGTTKETLRHYKDLALLIPAHRGNNGYFYYDVEQFYDFYAISIFRQTGTALEEIHRCLVGQKTAQTLERLREQRRRLTQERQKLEQMDFVLHNTIGGLEMGAAPDLLPRKKRLAKEHLLAITVEELEGWMTLGAGEDEMLITVLERSQALCREYGLQTDYLLGAVHHLDREPGKITHLYTRIKEKRECPYYLEKPAGTYLCLCCRGRWDISAGYAALSRAIQEWGVKTAGPLYAQDMAGFILNGVEKNAVTMLSVQLRE